MSDTIPSAVPTTIPTAVVTGAGRGFGRAIAGALVARGTHVIGIARTGADLLAVREELGERFTPLTGDATDEALAAEVIRTHRPGLLVLNAGTVPPMAPVQEQTWESFGRAWEVDTRHVFTWTGAALREPLAPGSVVVSMSSGAALFGSPLSGGYASAKAAVRYIRSYAAGESERAGLGIRFVALLPNMTPVGGVGDAGVTGYAAQAGLDRETFLAGRGPIVTLELIGKAVTEVADDPDAAAEYRVEGTGLVPLA